MPLILDGTLGVSGVDGTAAAPSIQGTDSNTGVFYATDIVGIATNGTERMRIDSSGNMSIATGNLTFSGSAQRIQWNMSPAAISDRVFFQTTVTNGASDLNIMPNGTGNAANFTAFVSSDPANSALMRMGVSSATAVAFLNSFKLGTGTTLPIAFQTDSTERMRIDTTGNVVIGTTTALSKLFVSAPTNSSIIGFEGNLNASYPAPVFGGHITYNFTAGGAEVDFWNSWTGANSTQGGFAFRKQTGASSNNVLFYIRGDGNVGIGTTNPTEKLVVGSGGNLLVAGASTGDQYIRIGAGRTGNGYSYLDLQGDTTYSNGLRLIRLNTGANAGSSIESRGTGAFQFVTQEAAPILFFTNGANERMRITSGGNVGIGNSNPAERLAVTDSSGTTVVTIRNTNGSTSGFCLDMVATPAASTAWTFMRAYSGGSSIQYLVYGNGNVQNTNGSYGTLSDVRIKENIIDATPKLDDLLKVRVRNYNLKSDLGYNTNKQIGVIAQELETIFPGLVEDIPDKDSQGKDTGTSTKSVKMSVFTPILIKAIQEQQKMIEELTSRINKLEGV